MNLTAVQLGKFKWEQFTLILVKNFCDLFLCPWPQVWIHLHYIYIRNVKRNLLKNCNKIKVKLYPKFVSWDKRNGNKTQIISANMGNGSTYISYLIIILSKYWSYLPWLRRSKDDSSDRIGRTRSTGLHHQYHKHHNSYTYPATNQGRNQKTSNNMRTVLYSSFQWFQDI